MFWVGRMMIGVLLLLLLQITTAVPRDGIISSQEDIQKDETQVHWKVDTSLESPVHLHLKNTFEEDDNEDSDDFREVSFLDALVIPKSRVKRGETTDKADDELHLTRVKRKSAKKVAKKVATAYVNNKMKKKAFGRKKKGGFMKLLIVVVILAAIAIGAVAFCIIKVKSMYTSI